MMTESQASAEGIAHGKFSWIVAVLYGRGSTMDRTFRYLSSHGLIAVALAQPFYKTLRLLHEYTFDGIVAFNFNWVPLPVRVRVNGTHIDCSIMLTPDVYLPFLRSDIASWKRIRWVTIAILVSLWMTLWLVILSISGAILTLPGKIVMTAFRCWSTTLTSAFRSVPILIATLVIIFTTGDAWRLYGSESPIRFGVLTISIFAIAIAAMVIAIIQVEGGWRRASDKAGKSVAELAEQAKKTPARNLVTQGVEPTEDTSVWYSKWVRRNVRFMFWFTLIANLFSVALITSVVFLFIGMVAVSAGATKNLLQSHSIDIIWSWKLAGQSFVMTRPLLLLSILFGCVAALTFATASLQDERNLSRFMQFALLSHRRSLSALAYYFGSILSLQDQLSWQAVSSELQSENRSAILDVFQMMVEQSRPWVISAFFEFARNRNLEGWAGSQGLSILFTIPDRKFVRISAESREFILTSAAADPARVGVIQSIRRRIERLSSNAE